MENLPSRSLDFKPFSRDKLDVRCFHMKLLTLHEGSQFLQHGYGPRKLLPN